MDLPPEQYYDSREALFVSINTWATTRVTPLLHGDQLKKRTGNLLSHTPVIDHQKHVLYGIQIYYN